MATELGHEGGKGSGDEDDDEEERPPVGRFLSFAILIVHVVVRLIICIRSGGLACGFHETEGGAFRRGIRVIKEGEIVIVGRRGPDWIGGIERLRGVLGGRRGSRGGSEEGFRKTKHGSFGFR